MATPPARRTVPSRTAAPVSSGYRGAEGRRKMAEEEERAAARREASAQMSSMPFRFYCPVGEMREYIIVDESPDFFRFEHNMKDSRSGKWTVFCACINENANCPVCKVAERPSYFAMYLTIIDLTPYEAKDGETVEWSKKLLVVKPAQQKKFTRLFERHGSLRGMVMQATRDGEKDASIGNDQEFIEFMEEEDLLTYEAQYTDKNKKVHDVVGHEVFDYDELFPMPTEQQLRALVGGKAEPGSRDDDDRPARRAARGDDWDEGAGMGGRRVTAVRRGRATAAEPEEEPAPVVRRRARPEPEEAPEADDAPPARTRAPLRTRAAPVEEEPEAEVDDAPPARTSRAAPARTATRRAVDQDADDEPPQRGRAAPEAPARNASSLAERRRALRR